MLLPARHWPKSFIWADAWHPQTAPNLGLFGAQGRASAGPSIQGRVGIRLCPDWSRRLVGPPPGLSDAGREDRCRAARLQVSCSVKQMHGGGRLSAAAAVLGASVTKTGRNPRGGRQRMQ